MCAAPESAGIGAPFRPLRENVSTFIRLDMLMILKLDQMLRPTSNEGIFNQALIILMNSRRRQIDVM